MHCSDFFLLLHICSEIYLRNIFVIMNRGLPHGQEKSVNQEKSGKTKQNDKSQEKSDKMGVFEKSQEN